MKIGMLVVSVIGLSLTCITRANDLPRLGHAPLIPVKDLVAKGYRWVAVNGPYACATEQDVRQITSDHTDLRELYMVENLQAYYLIPGALVRVIRDDHANGMSEILMGADRDSTCVESGGEVVLLDPLAPGDDATDVWARLDARPPTVIVILKPDHVRDLDLFARRYKVRAFGPQNPAMASKPICRNAGNRRRPIPKS
jgi:hypothetical protein